MARRGSGRRGKGSGKFGSGRKSGRTSGRKSGRVSSRRRPAAPRAPRSGGIRIKCMECYDTFFFHPSTPGDVLVCTTCGHAARRPNEDKLHEIDIARRPEYKALFAGTVTCALMLASFFGWIGVMAIPELANQDALFYGPMGLMFLFFVISGFFAFKYEGARHETYF